MRANKTWRIAPLFSFFVILGCLYTIGVTAIPLVSQLTRNYPTNPWEAGITLEALRFTRQMPLYESFETGHATQMYGWMNSALLGIVFHFLPVHNSAGRVISLLCSLLLVSGLTYMLSRGRGRLFGLFSFAALFSVSAICDNYFAAGRLDMVSILCGAIGVWFSYQASMRKEWWPWIAPIFFFLLGVSFKQTAAAFTLIPLVAICADKNLRKKGAGWKSLLRLLSVLAYFGAIKVFFPMVFEYMVMGFTHYPVPPKALFYAVWTQLAASPLLLVLLFATYQEGKGAMTSRIRWLLISAFVLLLPSCVAYAKAGGSPNSLMPYYLAMTAACMELLYGLRFTLAPLHFKQAAVPAFLLLVWAFQTFPAGPKLNRYYFLPDGRQSDYLEAVNYIKGLKGTVYCPEDPTLAYFASGKIGRNVYLERDVRGGGTRLPASLESYVVEADYIVDVVNWMRDEYVSPESMQARGYKLHKQIGLYAIWRKAS